MFIYRESPIKQAHGTELILSFFFNKVSSKAKVLEISEKSSKKNSEKYILQIYAKMSNNPVEVPAKIMRLGDKVVRDWDGGMGYGPI